jgi:serine/threonine-protein kinase ATR
MTDLAPYVVSRMVSQRSLLKEVSRVLHWGREAFVANTLSLTLPKLFMDKNQQVVRRIADMLNDGHLPEMLSPHIDKVLAQVYLLPDIIKLESSLAFVLSIYSTGSDLDPDIATILAAHLDKVITVLIIAFGENSSDRQAQVSHHSLMGSFAHILQVIRAVERIAVSLGDRMRPVTEDQSIVGVVLSMRTRGVVNELVQTLQNARSKHPNSHKVTILHGLNWMISQVGPGFTNVAPQVQALLETPLHD